MDNSSLPCCVALWRRVLISRFIDEGEARYASILCKCVLVFDWYHNMLAKDREWMQRAGVGSEKYNLTTTSPLPISDTILKNEQAQ